MTAGLPITPLDGWIAGRTGTNGGRAIREQIAAYQLGRLNETITRARSLSPFYRRHLASTDSNCLARLEDLADYPLTTSADIAKHALRMVCGSQSDISRVVTINTSGTTGNPKRLYFTPADQELTVDFFRWGMATLAGPGDKTLILLPGKRPGSVGDLLLKGLERLGAWPVPFGPVDQVADAVRIMGREQATCLVGVPVQVLAMARYWERRGRSQWAPRRILLSTDHIPAAIVAELQRIWRCEVYEHYGMTEMGLGGGLECQAHHGYHLREADLYFEIIDPGSLQPLPDGEYGEVVFTTLTRQGMPLIRYRTGDSSRFIPEPCPCGSKLRRLERIRTRKDGIVCCGANQTFSLADLDEALFALPGLVNFTVGVTYAKLIRMKVVAAFAPADELVDEAVVLRVLRQLPALQTAERDGRLLLEAEVVGQWYLPPGKRAITVIGGTQDDAGNA